jgi:hypothetical protein
MKKSNRHTLYAVTATGGNAGTGFLLDSLVMEEGFPAIYTNEKQANDKRDQMQKEFGIGFAGGVYNYKVFSRPR